MCKLERFSAYSRMLRALLAVCHTVCDEVVGMIDSVSVGADDSDLSGNRFLSTWVTTAIKSLGDVYFVFGWMVR